MRTLLSVLVALGAFGLATAITLRVLAARDEARLDDAWTALARGAGGPGGEVPRFDPASVADLPEPARRWFLHAIAPGAPLVDAFELRWRGGFRLRPDGDFARLEARELLAPPRGFVWRAELSLDGVDLAASECYVGGEGVTRVWWRDFLPSTERGVHADRGARGRLAFGHVFVPAALLPGRGARIEAAGAGRFAARLVIDGEEFTLVLAVAEDGALREVGLDRWSSRTEDGVWDLVPFGARVLEERTFAGYTVPARLEIAWWPGGEREELFQRLELETASVPDPSGEA